MRLQSLLLAATAALAAAHYEHPLHARRADAVLRARDAVAEVSYYNKLLARSAYGDFDDDDVTLFGRDAEPDYDDGDFDGFDLLAARSPGNKPSKPKTKVDPHPPKLPKLKHCSLCKAMCKEGEQWHRNGPNHPGGTGACVEIPGQH